MANNVDSGGMLGSKQLKVDNWGTFFIHRLQMLYDKNDYCDVTLKFHDGGEIKVHKLVLLACTDYFQNLTMTPDNTLVLPPVLKHNNVLPIVNFMYTGKLDFKYESSQNIVNAAKLLNMSLLVKLLNAQIKKEGSGVGLSPSTVTKSYVKKVTSSPTSSTTPTSTLPGKKLPFWKKRTKPGHMLDEFQPEVKAPRLAPSLEDAKPTRFEWPEETDAKPSPVMLYSPSFDYISYDSELMVKPVDFKKPLEALENNDQEVQNSESFTENLKGLKTNNVVESCFGMESDDDDDDDGHFESVHNVDPYDDDDDPPEENGNDVTVHNITERGYKMNEITELPPNLNPISTKCSTTSTTVSTPKPILKPLTSDLSTSSNQSKKVRFSLSSEGKENANKTPEKQIVVQNSSPSVEKISQKITTPSKPTSSKSKKTNSINSTNHAKIIAEVLKKYPELVKNNKNIRLKIMAPNNKVGSVKSPASQPLTKSTPSGKSKVSYVVIKSELNNQQEETVVVSTPSSGAENTTGPWFCYTCGSNSEPLNFETYYLYRRHLQDVHMERIDARICEHCGYKSSKRNLHLYHLYTKHQIQPPRNTNFPKCDQCDYIALSDSLLMKHRNNHVGPKKDYHCKVCTAGFKSYGALQGHMQTSLHSDNSNKEYQCEFCEKVFNRNINLKAHIRTVHKDESRKLYDEEDTTPQQNLLQVIQVPVIESLQNNLKGPQTLLLPPGMTLLTESPGVPLLQSSESEALNSVASGIATSLNLNETNLMSDQTVIFLDTNSELLFDQSGNPLVMAETTVVTDESSGEVQEYIIPEMITTTNSISQVFTTQASPVVTTTAEMVPISVCNQPQQQEQQLLVENPDVPASDHTYADESSQLAEGEVEENSEQIGANDATNNLVTTEEPGSAGVQVQEMNTDNLQDIVQPEQSHVTVDNDPLSRSVETIQFAASNSNNTTEISDQPMEVCERDSIIIQPSSVIQQPNVTVSGHSTCLLDENVVLQIGNNSNSLQCINSNSVIVSAAQPPMLISPKKQAKDELVEDWDDFDDEDVENTGSCSLGEMETNDDEADDIRPSRPTIELEESILPDM